jgi:hypothetical protein
MKLPDAAHPSRPWRIHSLAPDFDLEDVWQLPCRGGAQDFAALVSMIAGQDVSHSSSRAVRWLFAIRFELGRLLGWDDRAAAAEATLRDRLPADLRTTPAPEFAALPFTSLYLLDDEFAAETANRTVHGVMHIGWVPDGVGGFRGQMAVLVKPNGRLGAAYMATIRPFRRLIVYPALMGQIERAWRRRTRAPRRERAPA